MENIPIFVWQINSSIRMKLMLTLYYDVFSYSSFVLSQANSWKPLEDGKVSLQWDFLFGGQCLPAVMAEFVLFAWAEKGVEGDVWGDSAELFLVQWSLAAKWNGISGCLLGSAASSAVLSVLLGLPLTHWSWALPLCWIFSISQGFPAAGSLSQGPVPLQLTGTWGAGQSFHFEHISLKGEKSGAPHLAVFSHATILFQMKYDNTTVAVITVIDFREFKMIM